MKCKNKKYGKNLYKYQELLGCGMEIKMIDGENTLFKVLANGKEIEISGLDNRKQKPTINVYIWTREGGLQIDSRHFDVGLYFIRCLIEENGTKVW